MAGSAATGGAGIQVGVGHIIVQPQLHPQFQSTLQGQLNSQLGRVGQQAGTHLGSSISAGLQAGPVRSRITAFTRGLGAAAIAGFAAAGVGKALGAIFKTGLDEQKDFESGQARLQAGLKSTGSVAGITVTQMEDLASSIQNYSGQTDDSIVATEQLLLTFTNIRDVAGKNNDVFTQTVKIAADMAARLGGDASGAAIQLGKALNDPIKGITALTRVGVSFDNQQKAQIKTLVESGNVLGAQKIILAELNKEFGGSAKAVGNTLAGQVERAKRSFEDMSQSVVGSVAPSLASLAPKVADLAKTLAPVLTGAAHLVVTVLGGIINVGAPIISFFEHNRVAAFALATVLTVALLPAIGRVAVALGTQLAIGALNVGIGLANVAVAVTALPGPLAAIAAVATVVVGAMALFGDKQKSTKVSVDDLTTSLKNQAQDGGKAVNDLFAKAFTDTNLGNRGENVIRYFQRYKINLNDVINEIKAGATNTDVGPLHDTLKAILDDPSVSGSTKAALDDLIQTLGTDYTVASQAAGAASRLTAQQAQAAAANTRSLADDYGITTDQVVSLAKAQGLDLTGSLNTLIPAFDRAAGVTGDMDAATRSLTIATNQQKDAQTQFNTVTGVVNRSLSNQIDLLDGVKNQAQLTGAQLLQNVRDSLAAITNETANIQALTAKGLDPTVIKTLVDKGPQYVQAANQLSIQELGAFSVTYQQGLTAQWNRAVAVTNLGADKTARAAVDAIIRSQGALNGAAGRAAASITLAILHETPKAYSASQFIYQVVQGQLDKLRGKDLDVILHDLASGNIRQLMGDLARLGIVINGLPAEVLPHLRASDFGRVKLPTAATGGKMRGPGTGTSDSILAAVSNDEWVIQAASSRRYGDPAMAAVNDGTAQIAYAAGGRVKAPINRAPITGAASFAYSAPFTDKPTADRIAAYDFAVNLRIAEVQAEIAALAANDSAGPGQSYPLIIEYMRKSGIGFTQADPGLGRGGRSWHEQGDAVDFSGGDMAAMANYWMQVHSSLLELIHSPSWYVKNGAVVGPDFYGADIVAQHYNHVHVAAGLAAMQALLGIGIAAGAGSRDFGGSVAFPQYEALANAMMAAHGWNAHQIAEVDSIWTQESGFDPGIVNSIGAAGIPQAYGHGNVFPVGRSIDIASKQIAWGINYIEGIGGPDAAYLRKARTGTYWRGGVIPGTGTADNVPILATPGEGVVNRGGMSILGPRGLAFLNNGGKQAGTTIGYGGHAATGGIVGTERTITQQIKAAQDAIATAVKEGNGPLQKALEGRLRAAEGRLFGVGLGATRDKVITGAEALRLLGTSKQLTDLTKQLVKLNTPNSGLLDRLKTFITTTNDYRKSLADSLTGSTFTPFVAGTGTIGDVKGNLTSRATNIKATATKVSKLLALGYTPAIIRDIAANGIVAFGQQADVLLTGSKADAKTINSLFKDVGTLGAFGAYAITKSTEANPGLNARGLVYINQAIFGGADPDKSAALAEFASRTKVHDRGGWLPSGGMALNLSGRPEAVLDPEESQALKALVGGRRGIRPGLFDGAQVTIADNVDLDLALSKHDFELRREDV